MDTEPDDSAAGVPVAAATGGDPADRKQLERRQIRRLIRWLLVVGLVLVLVRAFIFEPYTIPTGSMRPTIIEGDVVLVNKLPYTIRTPRTVPFTHIPLPAVSLHGLGHLERGDVVVFDYPIVDPADSSEETQYVKRCVATAGDTVQLVDGRLCVNGHEVPPVPDPDDPNRRRRAPIARERTVPVLRDGDAAVVPFTGFRLAMDSLTALLWKPYIASEGAAVEYHNRIVFIDGLPSTHYTFKRDYFFALGDNSAVSKDSRVFGFVPYDNLIGQAVLVYWSHDPDAGIRWSRIGTSVH